MRYSYVIGNTADKAQEAEMLPTFPETDQVQWPNELTRQLAEDVYRQVCNESSGTIELMFVIYEQGRQQITIDQMINEVQRRQLQNWANTDFWMGCLEKLLRIGAVVQVSGTWGVELAPTVSRVWFRKVHQGRSQGRG